MDTNTNEEVLALHRQLAGEKLRADQGWQRAEAKSSECIQLRERLSAANGLRDLLATKAAAVEPAAPHIIEALSWHANERDDLTLEDAVEAIRHGWKKVRGRSEREMLLQIAALLAAHPAEAAPAAPEQALPGSVRSFLQGLVDCKGGMVSGSQLSRLAEGLLASVAVGSVPAEQGDDESLFWPSKALLKREDWDPLTRKPRVPAEQPSPSVPRVSGNTSDDATKWAGTFYRNADSFTLRDLGIVQAAWAEATRRAHVARQAQAAPVEVPEGALHNGEVFANQLENIYDFECEAGPLRNCAEWIELRRCMTAIREYFAAAQAAPAEQRDAELNQALWLLMEFPIHRYLMSNAHGRWDGAEKATRHIELCKIVVAVTRGIEPDTVRQTHEDDYEAVHHATQELTDRLDEAIGFPLESDPDYDQLAPLFFERFLALATRALRSTSTDEKGGA